ncbi:MAG: hypothetical protein SPK94_06790 [Bacteroidales bacterium]|nr:hypothetical protein [Bacteroidales bacterium]
MSEEYNGFQYEEPAYEEQTGAGEQRYENNEYSGDAEEVKEEQTLNNVNEVNEINPHVADEEAPLVIFYGPKNCGKTMTLVRLAKYLGSDHLSPESDFRKDGSYKRACANFNEVLRSNDAAASTAVFDFILVNMYKNKNKKVARILEAPGEHFFQEINPTAGYYSYFTDVIASKKYKRIWCFFVPLSWEDRDTRKSYASKINKLLESQKNPMIKKNDKVLFICSKSDGLDVKVDNKNNLVDPIFDRLKTDNDFKEEVKKRYPDIFNNFSDAFWTGSKKPFKFITFSAGSFTKVGGGIRYDVGDNSEPEKLLKTIEKLAGFTW